jgi:hypothetical protein
MLSLILPILKRKAIRTKMDPFGAANMTPLMASCLVYYRITVESLLLLIVFPMLTPQF